MKYSFKRPLILRILFVLSSIFTLGFISVMVWTLLIGPEVLSSVQFVSGLFNIDSSTTFAIIIGIILILPMKWFGIFTMFSRKTWGYFLFIIPNLLFLTVLAMMIYFGVRSVEIFVFSGITFLMMILYTIELFCLRGLRKKEMTTLK